MDRMTNEKRPTRRQAQVSRFYPQWGMEVPARKWNGHSLYRGGQRDMLMRYIIAPSDKARILTKGFTVLDLLIVVSCVAFVLFLGDVIGLAFDQCADQLGW